MKRIIIFSLCFCFLFLSACSDTEKAFPDDISCEEILGALQSVDTPPESEKLYCSSGEVLDSFSMSLWADGLYAECEKLPLLEDYAIFLGAGTDTYEVTVLKAKDEKDVPALVDLIDRRKETLANGDKGMYDINFETRMENSRIETDGRFVIFLLTDNNDSAWQAAQSLKK